MSALPEVFAEPGEFPNPNRSSSCLSTCPPICLYACPGVRAPTVGHPPRFPDVPWNDVRPTRQVGSKVTPSDSL